MSNTINGSIASEAARAALASDPGNSVADRGIKEKFGSMLSELEKTQTTADRDAARLAIGEGNLHEIALSLEKAEISMRLALGVRNKIVEAYKEVMSLNV